MQYMIYVLVFAFVFFFTLFSFSRQWLCLTTSVTTVNRYIRQLPSKIDLTGCLMVILFESYTILTGWEAVECLDESGRKSGRCGILK